MAKIDEARNVYNTLCQSLDDMNWAYNKDEREDSFAVFTSAKGKDLTIKLAIRVDVDRQLMYLKSPMPFTVEENVRDTMALAITRANWTMLNGSFEMDRSDGFVAFKLVIPYMESIVSAAVCRYMIILSCNMVDKFNDKFKAIAEGRMTLDDFQLFINSSK